MAMDALDMQDWMSAEELDSLTELADCRRDVKQEFSHWVDYHAQQAVVDKRLTRNQVSEYYRDLRDKIAEISRDYIPPPDD
jgi:hypothetical protein